jgi:Peptidase A4 family
MMQEGDDRQDVLDEIRRRTHFYEKPPQDLNPLILQPAELAKYGIPPRPNAEEFPALADFWDEMFSPPLIFTEPTFDLPATPIRISARLFLTTSGHDESSFNWSGAYITPRDGQQFTEVHGRWVVPGVMAPAGAVGNPEFRSSVWIGLDGARRYSDSTLPQIGTAQCVNPPIGPPFFLWWQWWMRDNPTTFCPAVVPIAVLPGHRILVKLEVLSETQVRFLIKNGTTGQNYPPFKMDAPSHPVTGRQAEVSGATAEWIVERPANMATVLYNLPDYHQVTFTSCYAVQATLLPGGGPGLERTLDEATLISMYDIEGNPPRRVTISKPERLDADRFQANYVGP